MLSVNTKYLSIKVHAQVVSTTGIKLETDFKYYVWIDPLGKLFSKLLTVLRDNRLEKKNRFFD